eukprot:765761-Hanusia_phi.AAC.1
MSRTADGGATDSLYIFNTTNHKWTLLSSGGSKPPARFWHGMVSVNSKIYLYGGEFFTAVSYASTASYDTSMYLLDRDVYSSDSDSLTWSIVTTSGSSPSGRVSHSMVAMGSQIFLFGGIDPSSGESGESTCYLASDSFYQLDTKSNKWIVPNTTGSRPQARYGHSMASLDGSLYIFGGVDATGMRGVDTQDLYKILVSSGCEVGYGYVSSSSCTACAVGYYKYDIGDLTCTACPSFTTTSSTASNSSSSCQCNVGYESSGSTCTACNSGYYKSTVGNVPCTGCPFYTSTLSSGSTASGSCICNAGYTGQGTSCTSCSAG